MFETTKTEKLTTYIGARVADDEEAWLRAEMKRRRMTMSDLIRTALSMLKERK